MALSGHTHRVALLPTILGLPFRLSDTSRTVVQSSAVLNPLGQVPVVEDGEVVLADSNAILVYLSRRYDAGGSWLPREPVAEAWVQRWMSIAAREIMYGPATALRQLSAIHPGS